MIRRSVLALLPAALLSCSQRSWSHSWYDRQCCSGRDCEPLPDGAVTQVSGGYHVKYKAKLGLDVDVVVPHAKARPSQDGHYHGCATIDRFLCLYVPMSV